MKKFCAEIRFSNDAILENQRHSINIDAICFEHAEYIANRINPNLKVTGEIVSEIDNETGVRVDYDFNYN